MFADEATARVEILAKNLKVEVPRTAVAEIRDPALPLGYASLSVEPLSFDEAQKLNMGEDAMGRPTLDEQAEAFGCFGGNTPRGEGKGRIGS